MRYTLVSYDGQHPVYARSKREILSFARRRYGWPRVYCSPSRDLYVHDLGSSRLAGTVFAISPRRGDWLSTDCPTIEVTP